MTMRAKEPIKPAAPFVAHFVEFLELLKHAENKFHASLFNIRPAFPPRCMVKYIKCEVIDLVHSYASGALKAHWDTIGMYTIPKKCRGSCCTRND